MFSYAFFARGFSEIDYLRGLSSGKLIWLIWIIISNNFKIMTVCLLENRFRTHLEHTHRFQTQLTQI